MGRRNDNVVLTKSMDFAVRWVKLYQYLTSQKLEFIMSKQLLRCGTSIGANLWEAQEAISQKDFGAKVYISLKEARETEFWLKLLKRTDYLSESEFESINDDCEEMLKLLVSITKTIRKG